jgi:hypothetical protein
LRGRNLAISFLGFPFLAKHDSVGASEGAETTRSGDLFRARLDQIINLKHELAQFAGQIDWAFIDGEIAPLYSDKGRIIGVYGMTAVGAKRT